MSVYKNLPLSCLETQLQTLMDEYSAHAKAKETEQMTTVAGLMREVGEAIEAKINDGTVKREDLFVATKERLHNLY